MTEQNTRERLDAAISDSLGAVSQRDLSEIRADNVARCRDQMRLGHNDASLAIMGFAAGCIREARAEMEAAK